MTLEASITIQDRADRTYRLETKISPKLWHLKIFDGETPAGELNAMPQEDSVSLQMIELFTDVLVQESRWRQRLRQLLGKPALRRSYRFCGLGPALLSHFVSLARKDGFTRIHGQIKEHNLNENPGLPDWYRTQGFTVEATGCTSAPYALACEIQ